MNKSQLFELILFKAYADLRAEAARTYLSFSWWLIDPVLSMLVSYIVFGVLFQRSTEDFVPFLLIGLITWQWFANTIIHGAGSIYGNGSLMRQVYLPKIIFPSVIIIMDTIKFMIVFLLLILFLWIYGFTPDIHYLALPVLLITELMLIIAGTYLLAAVVPFVPDIKFMVDHFLHLMFFLSGIFFASSMVPDQFKLFFYLNPMADLIEQYRTVLMYKAWPDWPIVAAIAVFSMITAYLGSKLIHRFDYTYPRVVL